MNTYIEISKKIGWGVETKEPIPHPEVAAELLVLVRDEQNIAAFEKVFKVHRFAPPPKNADEAIALNSICQAFKEGKRIFNF